MNALAAALVHAAWLPALVVALPLAAAVAIGLRLTAGVKSDASEGTTAALARGAALGALLLASALALATFVAGPGEPARLGAWFGTPGFVVALSFAPDLRALLLTVLVAFVAWATLAFSAKYLHREAGFHRFFFALCLFLAGMLLIVLAGNAVLAFVGWELCGFSSWLLIGFADERPVATGNALFAFLANRIGDAAFLMAIGLSWWWVGSVDWGEMSAEQPLAAVQMRMLALGFVIAALAKSAQIPFTPWIARALEGPTPSSAVFYGALMVHAGIFLLLRIEPLLLQVPDMLAGVAIAGLATAVYGWLCGRVQSDVKSALAYATVTQVGLMFVACGLGWFTLAACHAALHALWRGYQFLIAPSWLLLAPRPVSLPASLTRGVVLYTAVLQGFWLDRLARGLLLRPTLALGDDVRRFDERVVDRALGMPDESAPARTLVGSGIFGRLLVRVSETLQRLEDRLVLESSGGGLLRLLHRVGDAVRVLEGLLEEPRYLMLMVMATFVVIL